MFVEFCSLATKWRYSAGYLGDVYVLRYWNGDKWIDVDVSFVELYVDIPAFVQAQLSIGI